MAVDRADIAVIDLFDSHFWHVSQLTLVVLMDDLRFHVLFNSVSNERLCAMELRLRLRFRLERGSN